MKFVVNVWKFCTIVIVSAIVSKKLDESAKIANAAMRDYVIQVSDDLKKTL